MNELERILYEAGQIHKRINKLLLHEEYSEITNYVLDNNDTILYLNKRNLNNLKTALENYDHQTRIIKLHTRTYRN